MIYIFDIYFIIIFLILFLIIEINMLGNSVRLENK